MRNHLWISIVVSALVVAGAGCKKKPDDGAGTGAGSGSAGAPTPTPGAGTKMATLHAVGLADPTPRLNSDAAKALSLAWKSYKAKSWDDAKAQFSTVLQNAPDYLPARWGLVRTFIGAGAFADATSQFEQLIARDYLGYAKKLDENKEFAALRAAPEWSQIGTLKARYGSEYAKNMEQGFFVVIAQRPAAEIKWNDKNEATLEQNQEAYFYDPTSKLFRRATETGGHVEAILPARRNGEGAKSIAFVTAKKLVRASPTDPEMFADAQVGVFDFDDYQLTGPASYKGTATEHVILLQTKDHGWHFGFKDSPKGPDKFFSFDTAKTGLVQLEVDADAVYAGKTTVSPKELAYLAPIDEGSIETKSDKQFIVKGSPTVITASRPVAAGSFSWSPKGNRIAYAGVLDACALVEAALPPPPPIVKPSKKGKKLPPVDPDKGKNELFIFDKEKNDAQRVAIGVSHFTGLWADEDRYVFDQGLGKSSQVIVYSISAHAPTQLPSRFGAGLYGIPAAACKTEALQPTDPPPAGAEGEDVPADEAD